jgi:hypothetical protein
LAHTHPLLELGGAFVTHWSLLREDLGACLGKPFGSLAIDFVFAPWSYMRDSVSNHTECMTHTLAHNMSHSAAV